MGLREYHRKRDFKVTPEPAGGARPTGTKLSFVVQKHAATRLHYDFRLELDGVLLSWAVPKGPSLDPADKRLAMRTEDHPLEYGGFEGVIPAGEYGGGTVLVWDNGTWTPLEDPRAGLRKGSLKFELHGHKLEGRYALVKMKGRDARDAEKSWLLIKDADEYARRGYDLVAAEGASVISGRDLEGVASGNARVWHSNRASGSTRAPVVPRRTRVARSSSATRFDPKHVPEARPAALPDFVAPQLATLTSAAPDGPEWVHEIKLDGYRLQCRVQNGAARLRSRTQQDWTDRFAPLVNAAAALPVRSALLDGEAAVLLPDGTTSFQALQNVLSGAGPGELVYFVFDLLHLDGLDLTPAPLHVRKEVLRMLLESHSATSGPLRFCQHYDGSGPDFFAQACQMGLEGVISKRRDAPYRSARGRDWVKTKCVREQEFVIGGFTAPKGARVGIGALLVGVHDAAGGLRYAGKVGTGFDAATLRDLEGRLSRLRQPTSPFTQRPPGATHATWVRPELVAQIAFGEWTADARLRHPSFRGLREDKAAREVVRELSAPASSAVAPGKKKSASTKSQAVEVAGVPLTHPERVLYPGQGTTKRDLAEFYAAIAEWILPHLAGRPLSLVRCPEGADKACFYQKHAGLGVPQALRRVKIKESKKTGDYLVVDDLSGLVSLVQMGVLEFHTWNTLADRIEQPDRLVFDLDPGSAVSWEQVIEAAQLIRRKLEALELRSFVKTTGSKGLHVVVPLQRGPSWDEMAAFAEALARNIVVEDAARYTASMSKAVRHARIFIDYLRNARGATSVAAYSTRARPGAPLSTPLRWEELSSGVRSDHYTVENLRTRLAKLKADPWADYWTTRQSLTLSRRKAVRDR